MDSPASENDTRKQPLFNNTQVRYKIKPLFGSKLNSNSYHIMVSGNTWRIIQDIRDGIGEYAGIQFDY